MIIANNQQKIKKNPIPFIIQFLPNNITESPIKKSPINVPIGRKRLDFNVLGIIEISI